MNLTPQEENINQSTALDQTTNTASAQEATTTPDTTPETSPSPETVTQTPQEEPIAEPVATEETTEKIQAETAATEELSEEEQQYQELLNKSDADIAKMSCAQITDDVVLLLQSGELPPRSIIDRYKSVFYSKMNSYLNTVSEENAKLRADAEAQEIRLKELLNDFKERNRKRQEEIAEEQKANLEIKRGLADRLRKLLTSSESFSVISKEYREITESWRNAGAVPP